MNTLTIKEILLSVLLTIIILAITITVTFIIMGSELKEGKDFCDGDEGNYTYDYKEAEHLCNENVIVKVKDNFGNNFWKYENISKLIDFRIWG